MSCGRGRHWRQRWVSFVCAIAVALACIGVVNHDFCTSSIGGLVAVFAGYADAAPKKQKKPPSAATTQNQPPKLANTYGAGCKNQGAFIVSGTCAN